MFERRVELSPMSPTQMVLPGPDEMSSQSRALAPESVRTALVLPLRSTAKTRLVSPLSLWVKRMSLERVLRARPLDSLMRESLRVRSIE